MAIGIQNYDGQVTTPDSDYPDGQIKDNTGANNGTKINVKSNGDFHQFFAKLLRLVGVSPSGLPENEYSGFQYIDASLRLFRKYGELIRYDGSSSYTASVVLQPIVTIMPGTGPGQGIALADITSNDEYDLGVVKVVNDSSNSVAINEFPGNVVTINYASPPYTLAAGKFVELTMDKVSLNWIVSAKN